MLDSVFARESNEDGRGRSGSSRRLPRSARRPARLLLALSGLVLLSASPAAGASDWEWRGVPRILAIGDVHGSFDKLISLLQGSGLVDTDLDWTGEDAHLVFCGDLVDRGPRDRSVLDLARKLQRQAPPAGGRVHVLLGNHEIMNLTRDLRYVSTESFAEFAADETKRERQQGFGKFRASFATRAPRANELRAAFDERYPPGYFAHARAFAPDAVYGSWLLEQPTVIKLNGVLFLHGGLTEEVAALGLDEINRRMLAALRAFVENGKVLEGSAPWPVDFVSLLTTASRLAETSGSSEPRGREAAAAAAVLKASKDLPFSPSGPVWYRGSSVEDEKLERERVARVLELLDARAEVVAHTVTRSGRITSRFNGRVYRSDVGMGYGRPPRALAIDKQRFLEFDPVTAAMSAPLAEAPQGEGWPQGEEELTDAVLEDFLRHAAVIASRDVVVEGLAFRVLELKKDEMHLRAAFGFARESPEQAAAAGRRARRRFQHQVAAYRLDRRMGLGMVPVSVLRTVAGKPGVAQIWMQSAIGLPSIEAYGRVSSLQGLEPQIARARGFSALIGLEESIDTGKMLLPVSRRVLIADNGIAFPEDPSVERYLAEGCGPVGSAFMASLRDLGRKQLQADLGDLLSQNQIDALLRRRDRLLELCETPVPNWSLEKVLAR